MYELENGEKKTSSKWNRIKKCSNTKTKAMIRLNDRHLYWWWFSCVLFCRLNIFVSHSNENRVRKWANLSIYGLIELLCMFCSALLALAYIILINRIFSLLRQFICFFRLFVYQMWTKTKTINVNVWHWLPKSMCVSKPTVVCTCVIVWTAEEKTHNSNFERSEEKSKWDIQRLT